MISYKKRIFRWSIFWTVFVAFCIVAVVFVPIPSVNQNRDLLGELYSGPYVIERDINGSFGLPEYLTRIRTPPHPMEPLWYADGWTFEIAEAYHYYSLETAQYDLKHQGGHLVSLRERIKP
jgi:hypothetical protein